MCFVVNIEYLIIKTCLNVRGETTIHSTTAIGYVLLERELNNYQLYGTLHVLIG